jgi:hypothetical protein
MDYYPDSPPPVGNAALLQCVLCKVAGLDEAGIARSLRTAHPLMDWVTGCSSDKKCDLREHCIYETVRAILNTL